MNESVLTIKQIAEYLNVTERTIYNLLQRGKLPERRWGSGLHI